MPKKADVFSEQRIPGGDVYGVREISHERLGILFPVIAIRRRGAVEAVFRLRAPGGSDFVLGQFIKMEAFVTLLGNAVVVAEDRAAVVERADQIVFARAFEGE